jgi:hypothetical protein
MASETTYTPAEMAHILNIPLAQVADEMLAGDWGTIPDDGRLGAHNCYVRLAAEAANWLLLEPVAFILSRHSTEGITPGQWAAVLYAQRIAHLCAEGANWPDPATEWAIALNDFLERAEQEIGVCSDHLWEQRPAEWSEAIRMIQGGTE